MKMQNIIAKNQVIICVSMYNSSQNENPKKKHQLLVQKFLHLSTKMVLSFFTLSFRPLKGSLWMETIPAVQN